MFSLPKNKNLGQSQLNAANRSLSRTKQQEPQKKVETNWPRKVCKKQIGKTDLRKNKRHDKTDMMTLNEEITTLLVTRDNLNCWELSQKFKTKIKMVFIRNVQFKNTFKQIPL